MYNHSMTSNFEFLKNKDKKLFNIIDDAEKLYRDGYFEQTIAQTRKFAEIMARNVLGIRRTTEETFDEVLGTLKDIMGENPIEKEFLDDMYFLKKQGNLAVHDSATPLNGNIALECLQRAFEASLNYAVKNGANKKILNNHYSIDLLMTGKTYKFSEKYQKIREEENEDLKKEVKNIAEFAKNTDENKVLKADFKKKKVIKDKKPKAKAKKEQSPKKTKKEKLEKQTVQNGDFLFYGVIFSVIFVLLVNIILFVLPF